MLGDLPVVGRLKTWTGPANPLAQQGLSTVVKRRNTNDLARRKALCRLDTYCFGAGRIARVLPEFQTKKTGRTTATLAGMDRRMDGETSNHLASAFLIGRTCAGRFAHR
jgi:hypothetical protein